jgi:hypothetical protein
MRRLRSNEGLNKEYRKHCRIYGCPSNRDLRICLECEEFPCKYFDLCNAEKLEHSSWYLDVWSNMKQIRETGLKDFLKKKGNWLRKGRNVLKKEEINAVMRASDGHANF